MSVPLPSPSLPITSPVPDSSKPRTRPTAIPGPSNAGNANGTGKDGASGLGQSPSSFSFRRGSRSGGASGQLGSSPAEGNWRERGSSLKTKGPERTVGGFDKKSASSPVEGDKRKGGDREKGQDKEREKEKGGDKDKDREATGEKGEKGLSHVPCRFFKAGTCTAGDSCQFSHEEGGKKEVCQWFLKGNCRFGHKCALAHIRPGEPISMDRKNKKAAQLESRAEKAKEGADVLSSSPSTSTIASAAPVPIRSALSSSMASPQPQRLSSSPMREPFGPPSGGAAGSPAAGFGRSPGAFGASPNRPSPLSASFSVRLAVPSALSLKGNATTSASAVPATTGGLGFSSSFSHSSLSDHPAAPPMSASFADGASSSLHRSIWARSASGTGGPGENLSPRRMVSHSARHPDVFEDEDEEQTQGEDLIPGSLTELLTPREMARRLSRRDSNESYGSPRRISPGLPGLGGPQGWTGERLAQSAGAQMGAGFLGSLWAEDGSDGRKSATGIAGASKLAGQSQAIPAQPPIANGLPASARLSLLSQRAPISPLRNATSDSPTSPVPAQAVPGMLTFGTATAVPVNSNSAGITSPGIAGGTDRLSPAPAYFTRATDPSSPSARALQEHAPGQSLPGGVATALSRLHLQSGPVSPSKSQTAQAAREEREQEVSVGKALQGRKRDDEDGEETMFDMDH